MFLGLSTRSSVCARALHPMRGGVVLLAGCALAYALFAPTARAVTTTETFTYTGGEQTFVVPRNITTVEVRAVGGHGGDAGPVHRALGGDGAMIETPVSVSPGETLYVEVGGVGQNESAGGGGGFNGGAAGRPAPGGAGGGGGASDVRTAPRSAGLSFPDIRLVVGAGGGGAGGEVLEGLGLKAAPGGEGGAADEKGHENQDTGSAGERGDILGSRGGAGNAGCGSGENGARGVGGRGSGPPPGYTGPEETFGNRSLYVHGRWRWRRLVWRRGRRRCTSGRGRGRGRGVNWSGPQKGLQP